MEMGSLLMLHSSAMKLPKHAHWVVLITSFARAAVQRWSLCPFQLSELKLGSCVPHVLLSLLLLQSSEGRSFARDHRSFVLSVIFGLRCCEDVCFVLHCCRLSLEWRHNIILKLFTLFKV